MGSTMPDWLKFSIVSAISLAAGVLVGGWFTLQERAGLEIEAQLAEVEIADAKSQLTEKDAAMAKLTAQLDAVDSRISGLNEKLSGFEAKLTEAEGRVPLVMSFASIAAPAQPQSERAVESRIDPEKTEQTLRTRCSAITLKGTQCKRRAKPGDNGKCWQHQE